MLAAVASLWAVVTIAQLGAPGQQPWDVDSAFVDRKVLVAGSSTTSAALRVERDMIAAERDMWRTRTAEIAEAALRFERRAIASELAHDAESRAHRRTKAQLNALLLAPATPVAIPDRDVNISLLPDWIAPAAIGIAIGVGAGVGIGLVLGD